MLCAVWCVLFVDWCLVIAVWCLPLLFAVCCGLGGALRAAWRSLCVARCLHRLADCALFAVCVVLVVVWCITCVVYCVLSAV